MGNCVVSFAELEFGSKNRRRLTKTAGMRTKFYLCFKGIIPQILVQYSPPNADADSLARTRRCFANLSKCWDQLLAQTDDKAARLSTALEFSRHYIDTLAGLSGWLDNIQLRLLDSNYELNIQKAIAQIEVLQLSYGVLIIWSRLFMSDILRHYFIASYISRSCFWGCCCCRLQCAEKLLHRRLLCTQLQIFNFFCFTGVVASVDINFCTYYNTDHLDPQQVLGAIFLCVWSSIYFRTNLLWVCASDFHVMDLFIVCNSRRLYNISDTFAQAIHDELQQLDIGLQQLDGATRAAVAEIDDDHRRVIAQSVSNLAARIKELEEERRKQESDLVKKQAEWNDYQVRWWRCSRWTWLMKFWLAIQFTVWRS